jgi:predicted XRE-type DNA-binding protein
MRVKAQLAMKIGEIIKRRHPTQIQAADVLGMTQPKLSNMLRGQFRGISESKMLDCLARLGRDVKNRCRASPSIRQTRAHRSRVFRGRVIRDLPCAERWRCR